MWTWLLGKLGLQLAGGAGVGKLIAVLALVAVTVVAGGVSVWYVANLGKRAAVAKCDAETVAARDEARDAKAQAREANREVIIRHTADATRLEADTVKQEEEVKAHVDANPQLVLCSLNDRGLRLWNADPLDGRVPDRPAARGAEPVQPAPRPRGNSAAAPGEPRPVEAHLQGALAQAPGPGR